MKEEAAAKGSLPKAREATAEANPGGQVNLEENGDSEELEIANFGSRDN
jgi:hypothetical protein